MYIRHVASFQQTHHFDCRLVEKRRFSCRLSEYEWKVRNIALKIKRTGTGIERVESERRERIINHDQ